MRIQYTKKIRMAMARRAPRVAMAAMAPMGSDWALVDGDAGRGVDVEEGVAVEFDVGEFWARKGGVS